MGYLLNVENINTILAKLSQEYVLYAPKRFVGGGTYSDTDRIRYGEITSIEEIVFDEKSEFSYKEILTPISDILFYFTENEVKEADGPVRGAIVFLHSCDLHAVNRLDDIYLRNDAEDYYYKRIRERTKFILMGCAQSYENCFCVSMGTNQCREYDAYIQIQGNQIMIDNQMDVLEALLKEVAQGEKEIIPEFVTENQIKVCTPENRSLDSVIDSKMWEEYKQRCIGCGRCNFVCPTCTCFTMQDIFYSDNGKVGERRRVWVSCMVYDYKKRFGYHMCVGCGRCDDICPEYISFSNCINKLTTMAEGDKA